MLNMQAIEAFIERQQRLLNETFDRSWALGRARFGERGRLSAPDPARKRRALGPAFSSLAKMRRELRALRPSPAHLEAAAALAATTTGGGVSVEKVAEGLAVQEYAKTAEPRLLAGRAVVWSGVQLGTAEAADRSGQLLAWVAQDDGGLCATCAQYASEAPRRLAEWPTTPGAGDTPCSYGCRCRLVPVSLQ